MRHYLSVEADAGHEEEVASCPELSRRRTGEAEVEAVALTFNEEAEGLKRIAWDANLLGEDVAHAATQDADSAGEVGGTQGVLIARDVRNPGHREGIDVRKSYVPQALYGRSGRQLSERGRKREVSVEGIQELDRSSRTHKRSDRAPSSGNVRSRKTST